MSATPDEKGIHQWLRVDQFPEQLKKYKHHEFNYIYVMLTGTRYWFQRFKIWEQYDKGIWMTEDAWFGVTPEPIAKYQRLQTTPLHQLTSSSKIAAHIAESAPKEKTIIVDTFAGVGGNAIALARSGRWERVFAIEKDPKTMKCAKHNAEIYGVSGKIFWLTGDCFDAINRFAGNKNVVIFASPPWGGTSRFSFYISTC